jgi:hypothetical protein
MTNTVGRLTTVPLNSPGENPVDAPTYVSARALAANTAENITIPAGQGNGTGAGGIASFVRLAGTADFYYSFTGAASVPVDTDDGSACELIKAQGDPVWLKVPPGATALSVVSATTAIVTASFYLI